jgi:uncharacterized membrane protein YgcG
LSREQTPAGVCCSCLRSRLPTLGEDWLGPAHMVHRLRVCAATPEAEAGGNAVSRWIQDHEQYRGKIRAQHMAQQDAQVARERARVVEEVLQLRRRVLQASHALRHQPQPQLRCAFPCRCMLPSPALRARGTHGAPPAPPRLVPQAAPGPVPLRQQPEVVYNSPNQALWLRLPKALVPPRADWEALGLVRPTDRNNKASPAPSNPAGAPSSARACAWQEREEGQLACWRCAGGVSAAATSQRGPRVLKKARAAPPPTPTPQPAQPTDFYSTVALEAALEAYRRACRQAEDAVRRHLMQLAEDLQPRQHALGLAAEFATIAAALDGHTREATRRGWCLPTHKFDAGFDPAAADADAAASADGSSSSGDGSGAEGGSDGSGSTTTSCSGSSGGATGSGGGGSIELTGLWPYWLDGSNPGTVRNSFEMKVGTQPPSLWGALCAPAAPPPREPVQSLCDSPSTTPLGRAQDWLETAARPPASPDCRPSEQRLLRRRAINLGAPRAGLLKYRCCCARHARATCRACSC